MSAITQFRLTQFLCYISPEKRAAVEVKISNIVDNAFDVAAKLLSSSKKFHLSENISTKTHK